MNKAAKTILILAAFLSFSISAGTGIYFGIAAHKAREDGYISLTDTQNKAVKDCDLGFITPGESKSQEYIVKSTLNIAASCSLSFAKDTDKAGYDYITLSVSLDNEKLDEKKFSTCFSEKMVFEEKINENESKRLVIKYTLANDIPKEIVGTSLDFKLVFEAKAFG